MKTHETAPRPKEKGFWFLLSVYIGIAAVAFSHVRP